MTETRFRREFDCPRCQEPVALMIPTRRDASEFCPRDHFPMFWAPDVERANREYVPPAPQPPPTPRPPEPPPTPVPDLVVTCPRCGAANLGDSLHCARCGARLLDDAQPEQRSWWPLVGIVVTVVVVFVLVALAIQMAT